MGDFQAQIIGHRHDAAGGVTGAEITVNVGLGQSGVFQRAFGDFGVELCGGFIGCMPGWMLVNPGEIGLALDTQLWLSAGVSSSQRFSRLSGLPWQAPKYSVRRDEKRRHHGKTQGGQSEARPPECEGLGVVGTAQMRLCPPYVDYAATRVTPPRSASAPPPH